METISNWLWWSESASDTLHAIGTALEKDGHRLSIDKKQIENVCFKGGGVKGAAFVGVDRAFTELGLWPQVKRFIGSSAGAIFAGTAACRISFQDLAQEVNNTDFAKFKDSSWGSAGKGVRIIEHWGLYEGQYFYDWYRDILDRRIGDKDITLQGIYDRFGTELVVTTTDLTKKKVVFLNRHDHPTVKLCDAVRKSMSIPVFYVPVLETDDSGLTHVYVDGGCTDNFPLDYFDKLYESPEEAFTKTIGFDLEETQTEPDQSGYCDQTVKINNVIDLVFTLINTTIEVIERVRLSPIDKYRTVRIDTLGIDSTNFNISPRNVQRLAHSGYTATISFFDNQDHNNKIESINQDPSTK